MARLKRLLQIVPSAEADSFCPTLSPGTAVPGFHITPLRGCWSAILVSPCPLEISLHTDLCCAGLSHAAADVAGTWVLIRPNLSNLRESLGRLLRLALSGPSTGLPARFAWWMISGCK